MAETADPSPSLPLEVSPLEAERLLVEPGAVLRVVDCRDPDEFAFNRLPRAELIPLPTLPGDAAAKLPDPSARVLVYCHHGMRSARAALMLRQMGYENARSLAGGIDAWSREVDSGVPRY